MENGKSIIINTFHYANFDFHMVGIISFEVGTYNLGQLIEIGVGKLCTRILLNPAVKYVGRYSPFLLFVFVLLTNK